MEGAIISRVSKFTMMDDVPVAGWRCVSGLALPGEEEAASTLTPPHPPHNTTTSTDEVRNPPPTSCLDHTPDIITIITSNTQSATG